MTHLIVGGTSGIGLNLARRFLEDDPKVVVAGRRTPDSLSVVPLDIDHTFRFIDDLDYIVKTYSPFETVVYNPGFRQMGRIDELSDDDIIKMGNVGFTACALLMSRVMRAQESLPLLVAVTSTSEFTPRERESVYSGTKRGLGGFVRSLSRDERIRKTLVVAPAGTKTAFWFGSDQDTSSYLEASWVADQIKTLLADEYRFRYAHILRDPPRVDIVETEYWPDAEIDETE